MADSADGDKRAVVLQVAGRDDCECDIGRFRLPLKGRQRLNNQVRWGGIHDLVEDSEVNRRNVVAVGRVAFQDLTQNVLHDFVEVVLVERFLHLLVPLLRIICQVSQL